MKKRKKNCRKNGFVKKIVEKSKLENSVAFKSLISLGIMQGGGGIDGILETPSKISDASYQGG